LIEGSGFKANAVGLLAGGTLEGEAGDLLVLCMLAEGTVYSAKRYGNGI
jgi:hypothetical protein